MKQCPKCERELETSLFYIHSKTGKLYTYCKECCREIDKNRNKEKVREYNKSKYLKNRDKYNKNNSDNYYANREKYVKMAVDRERARKEEDPKYAFTRRLRDRIRKALIRLSINGKVRSCQEYGIDFDEIYSHVGERPSREFELDHIIPLNVFNLDNPLHVKLANSKHNLRWINGRDNRKKHTTIPKEAYENEKLVEILIEIGLIPVT